MMSDEDKEDDGEWIIEEIADVNFFIINNREEKK